MQSTRSVNLCTSPLRNIGQWLHGSFGTSNFQSTLDFSFGQVCRLDGTPGICLYFGDNLISWSSKKQLTVARSSTEVEYCAIAHVIAKPLWLESLMYEIEIIISLRPILYLIANPIFYACTKHVKKDNHFVREKVQQKLLEVHFMSSKNHLADGLIKPLTSTRFSFLRTKLIREAQRASHPNELAGCIKEIITTDVDSQD